MFNRLLENITQFLMLLTSLLLLGTIKVPRSSSEFTVCMVGYSTMSKKKVDDYPENGWGTPFSHYFLDEVDVDNYARYGCSLQIFFRGVQMGSNRRESWWRDYVFIRLRSTMKCSRKSIPIHQLGIYAWGKILLGEIVFIYWSEVLFTRLNY